MSEKNYITFIDSAGRNIFGTTSSETDSSVKVENPVMILVQQQENGQMAVQLYPLFFAEFTKPDANDSRNSYFTYEKAGIAVGSDFEIDPRIVEQYERIINPTLVPNEGPVAGQDPEVVKLFDEAETK